MSLDKAINAPSARKDLGAHTRPHHRGPQREFSMKASVQSRRSYPGACALDGGYDREPRDWAPCAVSSERPLSLWRSADGEHDWSSRCGIVCGQHFSSFRPLSCHRAPSSKRVDTPKGINRGSLVDLTAFNNPTWQDRSLWLDDVWLSPSFLY